VTPEDAETRVVDLQSLTMSDLTRDLHIGKKFSRHDELKERERQRKTTMRKKKEETPSAGPSPVEGGPSNPLTPLIGAGEEPAALPKHSVPSGAGVQFQIINGEIVIDQKSLAVDRHARAAELNGELESIIEDDFTRLITSNSFRTDSKLRGPNYWSATDTELFYRGLRMFGTDFETIAKMFPGRSRRHVKMKFNREERKAPSFVDAALTGVKDVKMDVDEYKNWTGLEFEDVGAIMAEQDRRQAEYDAEEKRIADEKEEDLRKKRAALFADDDDGGEEAKAVEDAAARAKKRKQKKLESFGEEVAIEAM
jgi:transcription factor TFIIIB component B''